MQRLELVTYMETVFEIELPATLLFDLPSFGDVNEYIESEINDNEYTLEDMIKCVSFSGDEVLPTLRRGIANVVVMWFDNHQSSDPVYMHGCPNSFHRTSF